MQLKTLLNIHGHLDWRSADQQSEAQSLVFDSRKVEEGSVYVAIRGNSGDGHDYIGSAIAAGALALVVEDTSMVPRDFEGAVVEVLDGRLALHALSQKFFGDPGQQLKSVAVTGTNGKTSCTYIIEHLLNSMGYQCGVMGTINHHLGKTVWKTSLTTPDPVTLQQRLKEFTKLGADSFVMEASSHAIDQSRINQGFDGVVFTNLSRDHLDYHSSMEEYFVCKAKLFQQAMLKEAGENFAIINGDDEYGKRLVQMTEGRRIFKFGQEQDNDFVFEIKSKNLQRCQFTLKLPDNSLIEVTSPLIGEHNVYNLVASLAVIYGFGLSVSKAAEKFEKFEGIPGRMQSVSSAQGAVAFIDYAHTPDALEKSIATLKDLVSESNKLITVFGCGGDRDQGKRPVMAEIASRLSNLVVITSDNPRTENPMEIIDQIKKGLVKDAKYVVEQDRELAIEQALKMAKPGDAVLVAGKGHEDYQIVGTDTRYFSDIETVKKNWSL